jgi:hypothetical protein
VPNCRVEFAEETVGGQQGQRLTRVARQAEGCLCMLPRRF